MLVPTSAGLLHKPFFVLFWAAIMQFFIDFHQGPPRTIWQGPRRRAAVGVDPHGYAHGVGMGVIIHSHRPTRILWGIFNQPEITR